MSSGVSGGILVVIVGAVVLLGLILVGGILAFWLATRGKKRTSLSSSENQSIDLDALTLKTIPANAPTLEVYGVPTQLAVLVLAPVGHGSQLPDQKQWRTLLEQLSPGFGDILDAHQPVFRKWEGQLSHSGFYRSFFGNMRSKQAGQTNQRWYKLAGRLDWFHGQVLVGIVARNESVTPLSPVEIDHPGKWREIVRVSSTS